ncbi:hypothetical protein KSF_062560 [Reticulibacter mediterranei]|uniref:Uncharacterized protein n=1 Tax=Reticulibacter mediterranei TaxID=2778369 RepID=A0A8J3IPJ7_9CHLR|nr:hypothetical protein KSF_062560 [Reticulibacter mediterranei]
MIQPNATSSAIAYYSTTNFSYRLVEQPSCNAPKLYTVLYTLNLIVQPTGLVSGCATF